MSNRVIAQTDDYCVSGDSLIEGDFVVWAPSPTMIEGEVNLEVAERMLQRLAGSDTVPMCLSTGRHALMELNDAYPYYQSRQTMLDALYNLSSNDIVANYSQQGGFNSYSDHSSLYASLCLSLAMLDPHRTMATLQAEVSDGLVMQREGTWPMFDDRLAWPIAAWEVYCVTGDSHWLEQVYQVAVATIDEELDVLLDQGLMQGAQHGRYAWREFYPDWATTADVPQLKLLINNVLAAKALEVANSMADELGLEPPYATEAQRLREALNQRLWDEARGRYSAYLLGQIEPMQAPLADNMAQALAIIWDLADDDRAATLIEQTPIGQRGIHPVYPSAQYLEPHLQYPSWTLAQAYWNVAAAQVGNEHALRRGLAALYRAQALYQPQHIHVDGLTVNSLSSAAANVGMIFRVLAGMRFVPDGIEFAPTVPACLPGNKTILGFAYRGALLDITLVGTGNDIALMTLDGQSLDGNYVPGDLQGHHNLLIKLTEGRSVSQRVTLAGGARLPATPGVVWQGDSGFIRDWQPQLPYKLTINGMRSYSLSDSAFDLPPLPSLAEVCVVTANRYGYSLPSRPVVIGQSPPIVVALSDSTLQADTLAVTVRTTHAGIHWVSVDYSLGSGCDILLVEANGHSQCALLLPADQGQSTRRSGCASVQLLRGTNRLILRRYRIGYRATVSRLHIQH